jgi:hypothetical protein
MTRRADFVEKLKKKMSGYKNSRFARRKRH